MNADVDVLVIGGGINGAGIARDAAGRGLSVLLAERGDYAGATSSSSSKLIHGGLRYLENFQFGLVREALHEREVLLRAAPHITEPLRFLLPMSAGQPRPAWMIRLGLWIYDRLAGRRQLEASGRLSPSEAAGVPHLRAGRFHTVLHYPDVLTDDARLVLETLLDARKRGADIRNYCEVEAARPVTDGYEVTLREARGASRVRTRYLINTAGPWTNHVRGRIVGLGEGRPLRLVRGSHIVLPMPGPEIRDAVTLQQDDGRVVFVLPWLKRFLVVGTTEVAQDSPDEDTDCSEAERDYLLAAVNDALEPSFAAESVVWSWAGVRPLVDDRSRRLSSMSRSSSLDVAANGRGGCITVYGGKITTYRRLAEKVMDALAGLGAKVGPAWTANTPLHGGGLTREALAGLADETPALPRSTLQRWMYTYGDVTRDLVRRAAADPALGQMVVSGVPRIELEHAWDVEDARTGTDFLERRTKLRLLLHERDRLLIHQWFADKANPRQRTVTAHES